MFDPRIQIKDGADESAIRRVWNATNVQWAYEAYNNGMPLSSKPFITGMPAYRKAGIIYDWSDWELQEAIACKNSLPYFAKHYAQLYRPDATYGLVDWYPFQTEFFKKYQENRFIIWCAARQSGKTVTNCTALLWTLIFGENQKMALLGDKLATSEENLSKIKAMYELLPFWLKPGVTKVNSSVLAFDNGNFVSTAVFNLGSVVGKTFTALLFDEFSIPPDKDIREVYEFVMPTVSRMQNSKILIASSAREKDHLFYELLSQALSGNSPFVAHKTDWWEIPGRGEEWKQEQIKLLGSESAFDTQFGNKFRTTGTAWLTAEASEYMDDLIVEANYVSAAELTDNVESYDKLRAVEPIIMKSKYVTKYTITPKTHLSSLLTFDSNYIHSLNDLKKLPIIITIDSGEGRENDFTVANFFVPEYDEDKLRAIEEANAELEQDIANSNETYYEDALDAIVDEESDELDGDFMTSNAVRCRQIGHISSNQHCIPMFALFIQVFVKRFCDPDKVKIVCELDGCGGTMRQDLAIDITKNSALDFENFAIGDAKGSPGIFMRGKNKLNFIKSTESTINESRILISYGATAYEMRKFSEVKKNQWEGSGAHDDETMSVVLLGAYMQTEDFRSFVEEILAPEDFDEDDEA